MIAEKYRALLQQKVHGRYRRQDIYDLDPPDQELGLDDAALEQVLETLMRKCESRIPAPGSAAMDDSAIRLRTQADWNTLFQMVAAGKGGPGLQWHRPIRRLL